MQTLVKDTFTKSSPNVNNSSLEHRGAKVSKLSAIIKKIDNKATTLLKVTNKTVGLCGKNKAPSRNNNNSISISKSLLSQTGDKAAFLSALSDNIRQPHVFTNSPTSQLVLRKSLSSNEPGNVTTNSREQPRQRTNYSRPPEDLLIPNNADSDLPNKNIVTAFKTTDTNNESIAVISPNTNLVQSNELDNRTSELLQNPPVTKDNFNFRKMLLSGLRMKERFVLCASVIAVLFTLMLIMDIQMDLGLSRKHLVPSHGRIKTVINEEGPEAAYHSFKNRLLQKTHR